jgi:glycosyltransferase involved in cell wall biosynthesis
MKVLHVTPHLGGGVGKAHAAIGAVLPDVVEQTFVLLEAPRERRYISQIESAGASVILAEGPDHVARLAAAADIVQFEFWNHPRLFECLARCAFPAMRSVFWSHISGLSRPLIPQGLMDAASRFVFTTDASLAVPTAAAARRKFSVINSGFGFAGEPRRAIRKKSPVVTYLGTVDFVKMNPLFFEAIDRLSLAVGASIWGKVDPQGPVMARAQAMRNPDRIVFRGETADPAAALAEADIFFYPLQPDHYGTAENALIEAMSLGLVPVVLNNPAEAAIVRDGETGFIAHSLDECISLLQMLFLLPDVRETISHNAIRSVAETRTPEASARDFMILWMGLLTEPVRHSDFRSVIGDCPADWFLATQCSPGDTWEVPKREEEAPAKGTLAHFESVFPRDASLARLRRLGHATASSDRAASAVA